MRANSNIAVSEEIGTNLTNEGSVVIFLRDEAARLHIPVSYEALMRVRENPELYATAVKKGVAFVGESLASPHSIKTALAVFARLEKVLSPEYRPTILRLAGAESSV